MNPAARSLAELISVISQGDESLNDEKQRRVIEFANARKVKGWQAIKGCVAYSCFSAVGIFWLSKFHVPTLLISIYWVSTTFLAWKWIGYPWIAWIANRQRLRSLDRAIDGPDFLLRFQQERFPFVLYLRDFASWNRPHVLSGMVLETDPLVRELSWLLPEDVYLVDLHDVYERADNRRNVIHVLSTDERWEPLAKCACAFAAMIIVALRQSGANLEKELDWIRNAKTLQDKTLLLYERASEPIVQEMRALVRWNAALWRPPTGENISGLDQLPGSLRLIRYSFSGLPPAKTTVSVNQ